jgi:hypothetical protein
VSVSEDEAPPVSKPARMDFLTEEIESEDEDVTPIKLKVASPKVRSCSFSSQWMIIVLIFDSRKHSPVLSLQSPLTKTSPRKQLLQLPSKKSKKIVPKQVNSQQKRYQRVCHESAFVPI